MKFSIDQIKRCFPVQDDADESKLNELLNNLGKLEKERLAEIEKGKTPFMKYFDKFYERCKEGYYDGDQSILDYAPDFLVFELAMEQSSSEPDLYGTIYSETAYSDCCEGMEAWEKFCKEHGIWVRVVGI